MQHLIKNKIHSHPRYVPRIDSLSTIPFILHTSRRTYFFLEITFKADNGGDDDDDEYVEP